MRKAELTVVKTEELIPADLAAMIAEDSGKGISTAAEDNIIPLIRMLQNGSPQVAPRDPSYVDGAVSGDFWFKNSAKQELVKGEEGFRFQPCYFSKCWIEWRPDRGGFAGRHLKRPQDAEEKQIINEGKEITAWVRPNGNTVIETREHAGFADGQPYVMTFTSTGHTESKQWMQLMNQIYVPGTERVAPCFSKRYHITSYERSNKLGRWFACRIKLEPGWVPKDEYMRGKALHEAFDQGYKHSASPDLDEASDDVPF